MKLIKYYSTKHPVCESEPVSIRYKILQNKHIAVQFYGVSDFNSIEELCSCIQNKRAIIFGSKVLGIWSPFPEPKAIDTIKEKKRNYVVIDTFKTLKEFKNLYSEYFI